MAERQNAYGYEELLACGRGELFGPGNAQLPLPPMLMFDRITRIDDMAAAIIGARYGPSSTLTEISGSSPATSRATR